MTIKEALQREGTAALSPTAVTFSFSPVVQEPYTVFWDVTAVTYHLVAAKAPVEFMEMEGLRSWLEDGRIQIDREHALSDRVDLSVPILAIHFDDGSLPIDGWHRVYRAIDRGCKRIPTIFLEAEEEYRFRYPQPLCDRLREISEDPGYQILEQFLERALRRGAAVYMAGV